MIASLIEYPNLGYTFALTFFVLFWSVVFVYSKELWLAQVLCDLLINNCWRKTIRTCITWVGKNELSKAEMSFFVMMGLISITDQCLSH